MTAPQTVSTLHALGLLGALEDKVNDPDVAEDIDTIRERLLVLMARTDPGAAVGLLLRRLPNDATDDQIQAVMQRLDHLLG